MAATSHKNETRPGQDASPSPLLFLSPSFSLTLLPSLRSPRPSIRSTGIRALSSKLDLEVVGVDLSEQLSLPVPSRDRDLLDGDLVEPGLDERPDGGEEVRGVDLGSEMGGRREREGGER